MSPSLPIVFINFPSCKSAICFERGLKETWRRAYFVTAGYEEKEYFVLGLQMVKIDYSALFTKPEMGLPLSSLSKTPMSHCVLSLTDR